MQKIVVLFNNKGRFLWAVKCNIKIVLIGPKAMKRKASNNKLQYSILNAVDLVVALWTYYDLEFTYATMVTKM